MFGKTGASPCPATGVVLLNKEVSRVSGIFTYIVENIERKPISVI
jgi:hypothetical protein